MPRPVHVPQRLDREALQGDLQLWALYERLFPACERESREVVDRALASGWGHVLRLTGPLGTEAFSAFQILQSPAAVFLVYLAVDPSLARAGRGAALFEASWDLGRRALGERSLTPRAYVWEVEDPEASASERERCTRSERITFFERHGGKLLNVPYLQPALHGGEPVPMRLMARAAGSRGLTGDDSAALVRALYFEKYGAINGLPRPILHALLERLAVAAPR